MSVREFFPIFSYSLKLTIPIELNQANILCCSIAYLIDNNDYLSQPNKELF